MDKIIKILKENGWSNELLDAIEKIARKIPSPSISEPISSIPKRNLDLHYLSISKIQIHDSTRIYIR